MPTNIHTHLTTDSYPYFVPCPIGAWIHPSSPIGPIGPIAYGHTSTDRSQNFCHSTVLSVHWEVLFDFLPFSMPLEHSEANLKIFGSKFNFYRIQCLCVLPHVSVNITNCIWVLWRFVNDKLYITRCSPLEVNQSFWETYRLHLQGQRKREENRRCLLAACFHAGFLVGLFFDHEDGGNMFLRNFGWHSTDYTALYPRR
jgi:hypothetical protein